MPETHDENKPRPAFMVHEPMSGQMVVQMNLPFVVLLRDFFEEMAEDYEIDREIWAFMRALKNPAACKALRNRELEFKRNDSQRIQRPSKT